MVRTAPAPRTTRGFALCWLGMLLLHLINVVYYVGSAKIYKALDGSFLAFQLMTYSIGIASTEYEAIADIHAGVAALHVVCILVMVGSSISARRLAFYPATSIFSPLISLFDRVKQLCSRPKAATVHDQTRRDSSRIMSATQLAITAASRTGSRVFGREGLLGVDGVYFDDILVVRELFETGLQSYQAYRMTQLLPRVGLILVYVILLVANCWAVPILHRAFKDQHSKRRMASLLCDAILDMVSSVGITLIIFATYAPQYNDPVDGFPFLKWFNDQWFTPLYQEFQMMLVASWGDMGSRLVFALGLLQCMETMKEILEPVPTKQDNVASMKPPLGPGEEKVIAKEHIQPVATKASDSSTTSAVIPASDANAEGTPVAIVSAKVTRLAWLRSRLNRAKRFLLHTVAPMCFVLWGCVILAAHIYASSRTTEWPCNLRLRPWFNAKPACALIEIDCHQLQVSGTSASLDAVWTRFEPGFAAHMTIRHCPVLEVPTAISQYDRLMGLKVYNSTIASWPETSALTSKAHTALRALYFLRSTFPNAVLPPGLTTKAFPKTLRSFIVSETNLASLPDDLHQSWPPFLVLVLEGCQFTTVPNVVMPLLPVMVSFTTNPLTSVPASLFEIPPLQMLHLAETLIQELPRDVQSSSPDLTYVTLLGTNVSTLWSWMDPIIAVSSMSMMRFNAHGSRYCVERDAIEARNRSSFSAVDTFPMSALASVMDVSTAEKMRYSKDAVDCEMARGRHYPLFVEDIASGL